MSERTLAAMSRLALALGIGLGTAGLAQAEPPPLSKEEQAKVDKAIDKSIAFLKRAQKKNGSWDPYFSHLVGSTALPALALLEAGVPADDPVVQKAAKWLRLCVSKLDQTYDLSLALLFFDRQGDPQDKAAIRTLALRLIAGQYPGGGWKYLCPTLSAKNEEAIADLLRQREEAAGNKTAPPAVPAAFKVLTVFRDPPVLVRDSADNSNTQFAALGLWVARRHDVPVAATLRLTAQRFENSQHPSGTWSYSSWGAPAVLVKGDRSMTTVGLVGLAMREGLRPEKEAPAGAPDTQVLRGFAAMSQLIGVPDTVQDAGRLSNRVVYYLWSLERVAMLYDLPTIGGKDWYRWGADVLLANQGRSGEFGPPEGGDISEYPVNTAFALLFLKRSHLLRDLTAKLPCKGEGLEKGIATILQGGRVPAGPAPIEQTPKKP